MKYYINCVFASLLFLTISVVNASGLDISGIIVNKSTRGVVQHARIDIENDRSVDRPVFTNIHGYFSVKTKSKNVTLKIAALGYKTLKYIVDSTYSDQVLLISLVKDDFLIPSEVTDEYRNPSALEDDRMGFFQTNIDVQKDAPVLGCEQDPIKTLQMLPGVEFGREGFSELFIRGGGAGQTLFLLDGMPVYGDNHAFGILSAYNQNNVHGIDVYRGTFSPRFGGRLSGVVDITSDNGDASGTGGHIAMSPLSVDLGFVGGNNRTTFSVDARRSYLDVLLQPLFAEGGFRANFFDINFNLKSQLSDETSLEFHTLFSRDIYQLPFTIGDSGNTATIDQLLQYYSTVSSVRLNHIFSKDLFGSFAVGFSGFNTTQELTITDNNPSRNEPLRTELSYRTGNFDVIGMADMEYRRKDNLMVRYGGQLITHGFNTGRYYERTVDSLLREISEETLGDESPSIGLEIAGYVSSEFEFSDNVLVDAGLRGVMYSYDGYTTYHLEPRINARIKLNYVSSLKLSFMIVNQFLHSLNNDGSDITLARWVPSTEEVPQANAKFFSAGYASKLGRSSVFEVELFYKILSNLYLAQDPNSVANLVDYRATLIQGDGDVFGGEMLLRKTMGNLTGHMSYGYSNATRTFSDLNGADPYPFNFDRRHTFKAGFRYVFDDEYVFTFNFMIGTGLPFTLPNSLQRDIDGNVVLGFDQINNYRSDRYRRLDIAVQRTRLYSGDVEHRLSISIYNVLAAQNTANVTFRAEEDDLGNVLKYNAYKSIPLVFFPGVRYEIKF